MNASKFRNTRFEIRSVHQGGNSFGLQCSDRNANPDVVLDGTTPRLVAKRMPDLEVPEEDFTDQEMALVHAVFEMLEHKYAARYDAWAADPERSHDLIAEAVEAERRLKAAREEHDALDAVLAAKRKEAQG